MLTDAFTRKGNISSSVVTFVDSTAFSPRVVTEKYTFTTLVYSSIPPLRDIL